MLRAICYMKTRMVFYGAVFLQNRVVVDHSWHVAEEVASLWSCLPTP